MPAMPFSCFLLLTWLTPPHCSHLYYLSLRYISGRPAPSSHSFSLLFFFFAPTETLSPLHSGGKKNAQSWLVDWPKGKTVKPHNSETSAKVVCAEESGMLDETTQMWQEYRTLVLIMHLRDQLYNQVSLTLWKTTHCWILCFNALKLVPLWPAMTTVAIQHLILFFPFVFSMAQHFARESDYLATATKGAVFFAVVAKRVWVGIS